MKYPYVVFVLLAILAGLIGGVGDTLANSWIKNQEEKPRLVLLLAAFLCWNTAFAGFICMLAKSNLAQVVVIFMVANSLFVLIMSRLYFQEEITPQKWVFLIIAILAVVASELS